jgi:hypothetical protein
MSRFTARDAVARLVNILVQSLPPRLISPGYNFDVQERHEVLQLIELVIVCKLMKGRIENPLPPAIWIVSIEIQIARPTAVSRGTFGKPTSMFLSRDIPKGIKYIKPLK